jgi:hypothetical protein
MEDVVGAVVTYFKLCHGICLQGLRKTSIIPIWVAGGAAKIRTLHLTNTRENGYHMSQPAHYDNFKN